MEEPKKHDENHEQKSQEHGVTKQEIEQGKGMAILAYIGILALIPYFAGDKKNKFIHFHAVQGMNILIYAVGWSIVAGIIGGIVWGIFTGGCFNWAYYVTGGGSGGMCQPTIAGIISFIIWLPSMAIGVLEIIGIVNAVQGKTKKIPLISKLPTIIKK